MIDIGGAGLTLYGVSAVAAAVAATEYIKRVIENSIFRADRLLEMKGKNNWKFHSLNMIDRVNTFSGYYLPLGEVNRSRLNLKSIWVLDGKETACSVNCKWTGHIGNCWRGTFQSSIARCGPACFQVEGNRKKLKYSIIKMVINDFARLIMFILS